MMLIAVANLLANTGVSTRDDTTVVAVNLGQPYLLGDLRAAVWRLMQNLAANANGEIVLALQDPLRFTVALFAGLHADCRLILPPNLQVATLSAYGDGRALVLRDKDVEPWPENTGAAKLEDFKTLDPDAGVFHFHTSGTTGAPKLIEKRLWQIQAELTVLERLWGNGLGDAAILSTVSPRHIYGLLFYILWPICAGRRVFFPGYEYWERLLADLPEDGAIVSSPAHLGRFPKLLDRIGGRVRKPGPKMVFSSGEPLPFAAAQSCHSRLGVLPTEVFGSSETGGIAQRRQVREDSPWQPFEGLEIDCNDTGCLKFKSSYLENAGWYQTEDRIALGPDGRFQLQGRADRMVKIAGKRLDLNELEQRLMALDWVLEAAVLTLPDAEDQLVAVLALSEVGAGELEKQGAFRLNRMLRGVLSAHFDLTSLPERWCFVAALPRNSQGKIARAELAAFFR